MSSGSNSKLVPSRNAKPASPAAPPAGSAYTDEFKARAARVKSSIRKMLLASPDFPRFYADTILRSAPNSREANILRPHYQKICEKVDLIMSQDKTCTHIKVSGVRCGSPALRGEQFCYFHQNAHRGVRRPRQSRLHPIALIEDEESIQYALMEVINALMRNTIDPKRAALILRALHIAVKNASRVKYSVYSKSMVKQVPEYDQPTADHERVALESELPAIAEKTFQPVDPSHRHFWEDSAEGERILAREAHMRAAARERARQERAEYEALVAAEAAQKEAEQKQAAAKNESQPAAATPATPVAPSSTAPSDTIHPHNFNQRTQAPNSSQRKPPSTVAPPPKNQKSAANAARHR